MTSSLYDFSLVGKICFGDHAAERVADILPSEAKNILFVSGKHAIRTGTTQKLADLLKQTGRNVYVLEGVVPEPPPEEVDRLVQAARDVHAECIAAIGGGSVIDAAKAAAALVPWEGTCQDYFFGKKSIPGRGLFFAALPTTAGTGAEMTSNSVLTDTETQIKKSLRSPFMTPNVSLNDPLLLCGTPAKVIASCGLDAFVQAAECYTSTRGNPFSRALSLSALKSLATWLPQFYADPENAQAREKTAEASMITGIAFAQTGLGAVHGLAHPAGSLLHIPHGEACAILMPHVFRFNAEKVPQPYAEMAMALGLGGTAQAFTDFAAGLAHRLGIPETMKSAGLSRKHYQFLIRNCRSGSMKTNPREMSDEQVERLLEKLSE